MISISSAVDPQHRITIRIFVTGQPTGNIYWRLVWPRRQIPKSVKCAVRCPQVETIGRPQDITTQLLSGVFLFTFSSFVPILNCNCTCRNGFSRDLGGFSTQSLNRDRRGKISAAFHFYDFQSLPIVCVKYVTASASKNAARKRFQIRNIGGFLQFRHWRRKEGFSCLSDGNSWNIIRMQREFLIPTRHVNSASLIHMECLVDYGSAITFALKQSYERNGRSRSSRPRRQTSLKSQRSRSKMNKFDGRCRANVADRPKIAKDDIGKPQGMFNWNRTPHVKRYYNVVGRKLVAHSFAMPERFASGQPLT